MSVFSLREHLTNQGVKTKEGFRRHFSFILDTEKVSGRRLVLSRYKVDENNPESIPVMG